VNGAAIDQVADLALRAMTGGPIAPAPVTLLLRRYAATGRTELRDAVESALTHAIESIAPAASRTDADRADTADWLHCFAAASSISSDERLLAATMALALRLRQAWPSHGVVAPSIRAVGACLAAAMVAAETPPWADVLRDSVDELERIVALTYEPGEGIAHVLSRRRSEPDRLIDQIETAATLVVAHGATDRLPYAMLADELMQTSRHRWWNDARGAFDADPIDNCRAARVMCRLAALHDAPAYREIAVVAPRADYAGDARRVLESQERELITGAPTGIDGAVEYALALEDFFRLPADLQ
jgi:hypothetical protein